MFLTEFRMQKYTGGIISWVDIFLTVTLAANKKHTENDTCISYLRHILQILQYSTRVAFSRSLQFFNYLPIIAPDYHPFVNRKGIH